MTYLSIADVRRASGAPSSLISDSLITSAIEIVEKDVERWMNTKFTPTLKIDIVDGSGMPWIFAKKNPILAVRKLITNDTDISVDKVFVNKQSGQIELSTDAETSTFINKKQTVKLKYLYALMHESDSDSTSSAATTAGTSVNMEVADSGDFAQNDWVEIYSTDGNREAAKISSIPDSTHIVLDELVESHESGSIVVKLEIPYTIKRYMEIEAGIYIALMAIGSTYTFNTTYGLGDFNVTKGVPYPHFTSQVEKLLKEREMRRKTIRIRPCIVV